MGKWRAPGVPVDPSNWHYDLSRGWQQPGVGADLGGTQFEMSPGDSPGGGPGDWSLMVSQPGVQAPADLTNYTPQTGEISPPGVQAPLQHLNLSMQPHKLQTTQGLKSAKLPVQPFDPMADVKALLSNLGVGEGRSVGVGASRQMPYADVRTAPSSPPPQGTNPPRVPSATEEPRGTGVPGNPYRGYTGPTTSGSGPQDPGGASGLQQPPKTSMPEDTTPKPGDIVTLPNGEQIQYIDDGAGGVTAVRFKTDPANTKRPGDTFTLPDGSQLVYTDDGKGGVTAVHVPNKTNANANDNPQAIGEGWVMVPDGNGGWTAKQVYTPYHPTDYGPQPQAGVSGKTGYSFDPTTGKWTTTPLDIQQPGQDISSGRHHAFIDPYTGQPVGTYDFPQDPQYITMGDKYIQINPDGSTQVLYDAPDPTPPQWYQDARTQHAGAMADPGWDTLGQGEDVGVGAKKKRKRKPTHRNAITQPGPASLPPNVTVDPGNYTQAMSGMPMAAPMGMHNTAAPAHLGRGADTSGRSDDDAVTRALAYMQQMRTQGDASPAVLGAGADVGVGELAPGSIQPPVDPSQVVGTGHRFGEQVDLEGTHKGVDLQAYRGTPTASPVDGTVVDIHEEPEGLGLRVLIQDQDGNVHSLNHLDSVDVNVGDQVKAGQPVAQVGSSGAGSTGPHLDYRAQDPQGNYLDPTKALGPLAQMPRADDGREPGQGGDTRYTSMIPDTALDPDPLNGTTPPRVDGFGQAGDGWPAGAEPDVSSPIPNYRPGTDAMYQGSTVDPLVPVYEQGNRPGYGVGADVPDPNDPSTEWGNIPPYMRRANGVIRSRNGGSLGIEPSEQYPIALPTIGPPTTPGTGGDIARDDWRTNPGPPEAIRQADGSYMWNREMKWTPPADSDVGAGSSDIAWKQKREHYVKSHGGDREKVKQQMFKEGKISAPKDAEMNKYFKRGEGKKEKRGAKGRPSSYLKTAGHLDQDTPGGIPANATFKTNPDGTIYWDDSQGNFWSDPNAGGNTSSPSGGGGGAGGWDNSPQAMDATNTRYLYENQAKYWQQQVANQAKEIANNYNVALQQLKTQLQISGDQIAYQKGKDKLDAQLQREGYQLQLQMQQIQNQFQGGQNLFNNWTQLMGQTAFNNPWLQELAGYAPGWNAVGGPQTLNELFAQSTGTPGGATGDHTLGQALGGIPTSGDKNVPSYQDWASSSPFQKAAARTQSELFGPGWDRFAGRLRAAWGASGGPTSAPGVTPLQSARMSDLDKTNQGMIADTFGQTANSYWNDQAKTWDAGAANQTFQEA